MTHYTPTQRGTVEYWHVGNGQFFARDDLTSAYFNPGNDVREDAYKALGRTPGDIQKEILG